MIFQDDCLKVLTHIPSESVDLVFADPPFNLNKKYGTYPDNIHNYVEWSSEWLRELVRITKPTGNIFIHNIPAWLIEYAHYLNRATSAEFKHWIAWDAAAKPLGSSLLPNHYGILYYRKSKDSKFYDIRYPHHRCRVCKELRKDYGGKKAQMHPFGPLVSDVWTDLHRIKHAKNRDTVHPCQLPVPLLERIILMASDEGDLVFDPFTGTGTALVAAKKMGRQYMGAEIDPTYVHLAEENIASVQTEPVAEGVYVSKHLGKIVTLRDKDWLTIQEIL